MKLYSVGYAHPRAVQQVESLMFVDSTIIVDIRDISAMTSNSMHPQWQQKFLRQKYGKRYRWAGEYLGLIKHNGSKILANPSVGLRGLLLYLTEGHDVILLCSCKEQEQCHRKTIIELLLQQEPALEILYPCESPVPVVPNIKALSIIQPYAMMLANPGILEAAGVPPKRIENRDWSSKYRGQLLIHASKRFDQDALRVWMRRFPALAEILPRDKGSYELGGIVGVADFVEVISTSDDPWFLGTYGFILANARPLPFVAYPGQPSLFAVPFHMLKGIEQIISS